MQLLEDKILKDGIVKDGDVLKVDSFLNHQIDVSLLRKIGKEFRNRFADCEINKIACIAAEEFNNIPVVFAKKNQTKNIANDVHRGSVESFTHGKTYDVIVSKDFLGKGDKVLIIDDFLAKGNALICLSDIVKSSGAELVGAGIVIEKGYQEGGKLIREKGIRLESLAIIKSMDENKIIFE